ncbi:transporter [Alloalcanivorax xenomutans]|uniref:transporter n=1 Tax=Alloalcanivorax xenomutans TaxID=1094342 RepID=UPI003C36089B
MSDNKNLETALRRPKVMEGKAAFSLLAGALFAVAGHSHAVDVDAGDYTALPAGTNLAMVYYQYADRDRLYSDGDRVPIDAGLESHVGILRGVHFTRIGDYIVDPQFLLPFGHLEGKDDTKSLGDADGLGDLILAATVWLVNKPETNTYFGITPFVYVPTGAYDHDDALNLGENRWKFALQAGYITGLTEKVFLDIAADVTVHGKNDDFGANKDTLKQDPLFQVQTFLRYQLRENLDLRAGLSHTFGGETEINGTDQDDRAKTTKMTIGSGWFVTPSVQLLANYGRDLSVENGFKENNRFNLRILKAF